MRDSSRRLLSALITMSALSGARPLTAATIGTVSAGDGMGARAAGIVHGFWNLVGSRPQSGSRADDSDRRLDLSDVSHPAELERRLRAVVRPAGAPGVSVSRGEARSGPVRINAGETIVGHLLVVRGPADIYGRIMGNLVTLDGDIAVHAGGLIAGDVLALGGRVKNNGGEIAGEVRSLGPAPRARPTAAADPPGTIATIVRRSAGVVGVFLTLAVLGFGLVMFGRPSLEVVSDTVAHSFGRAFVVGLLGQILLLPTFGMLVVGLVLSVAGILLLPFAVVVYALLVIVGVLGGYLAVAHAMGETWVRRRLARGVAIGSPNSYRYLLVGLGALATVWAAWSVFGWVPIAGTLIWSAAFFVTWLLGTAGFGAALLSRVGLRENFAGRFLPPESLTDEFLWATPQFGVTAARRPDRPPPRAP